MKDHFLNILNSPNITTSSAKKWLLPPSELAASTSTPHQPKSFTPGGFDSLPKHFCVKKKRKKNAGNHQCGLKKALLFLNLLEFLKPCRN